MFGSSEMRPFDYIDGLETCRRGRVLGSKYSSHPHEYLLAVVDHLPIIKRHGDHIRRLRLSAKAALASVLDQHELCQIVRLLRREHEPLDIDRLSIERSHFGVDGDIPFLVDDR